MRVGEKCHGQQPCILAYPFRTDFHASFADCCLMARSLSLNPPTG
jgi:hypothetical protein